MLVICISDLRICDHRCLLLSLCLISSCVDLWLRLGRNLSARLGALIPCSSSVVIVLPRPDIENITCFGFDSVTIHTELIGI